MLKNINHGLHRYMVLHTLNKMKKFKDNFISDMLILFSLKYKEAKCTKEVVVQRRCMYHENETHEKMKGTYDVRSSFIELYLSK